MTPVSSFQTVLPPVASTRPSARMDAFTSRLCATSGFVVRRTGEAPVMSMIRAFRELPPNCRILPGRYMAALESLPVGPPCVPSSVTEPLPEVFT